MRRPISESMPRALVLATLIAGTLSWIACSGSNDAQQAEDTSATTSDTEVLPPSTGDVTGTEPAEAEPVVEEVETPVETPPASETETPPEETPEPVVEEEPAPVEEEEAPAETPVVETPEETPTEPQFFEVADTKPGLTKIGAEKCKLCHKIQYESWLQTQHAALSPRLECESCHGSGSEYKKKSIMQDPALAAAAGLVKPDAAFCRNCHADDWNDAMLQKTHAHKEDEAGG